MSGFYPKDLIHEVKIRPGIYNRDALEHPRREHRHQLWLEVAESLTPAEDWQSYTDVEKEARMDEITTKWKHLRDHFYREIKLQEAGEAHKKRKYVYFDDMEFMRPFVGYKLTNSNKANSIEETQDYVDNDTEIDMDAFLKSTDNVDGGDTAAETEAVSGGGGEDVTKSELHNSLQLGAGGRPKRVVKPTPKALQNKPSTSTPSRVHKEAVIKNFNMLKKTGGTGAAAGTGGGGGGGATNPTFKIRDGDISFCLSLVPTLRKLGDGRKLRAKIEILKVLHRYVEHTEKRNVIGMQHGSNHNNSSSQMIDHDDDMAEDHLEEYEDAVNVKHEEHDDPLNGGGSGSGNTKAWWT